MNKSALKFVIIGILCVVAFTLESYAQTVPAGGNKNFPFSQNPKRKPKTIEPDTTAVVQMSEIPDAKRIAAGDGGSNSRPKIQNIAAVTNATRTKNAAARNAEKPATELYRVGNGDVLDIKLLNSDSKESTLFTVMDDGSIDYPLAGGMVQVGGMTNDEIEEMLADHVKLYENPEVAVSVRSFGSHPVTVLGQVEKPGGKSLRREAVPLYVLLAEVVPNSSADKVVITRADKQTVNVNLEDASANEMLIYPGDVVRITSNAAVASAGTQFYYISGVQSAGEKSFRAGMTLTQAILACGGSSKSKVTISRQNEQGLLTSASHNLKDIKDGKAPDPVLQPGDRIEVR
jgi:protein involved in polysaccharide export with SLBB domain